MPGRPLSSEFVFPKESNAHASKAAPVGQKSMMLSDPELRYVLELLQREIPSLRDDIWHADTYDDREFLKERERLGKVLVEKFSTYSSQMATA